MWVSPFRNLRIIGYLLLPEAYRSLSRLSSALSAKASALVGFPIQKSPDHRIFAPPRSLSQLITSFIGSQCQGIRPALFFAWPFRYDRVNI